MSLKLQVCELSIKTPKACLYHGTGLSTVVRFYLVASCYHYWFLPYAGPHRFVGTRMAGISLLVIEPVYESIHENWHDKWAWLLLHFFTPKEFIVCIIIISCSLDFLCRLGDMREKSHRVGQRVSSPGVDEGLSSVSRIARLAQEVEVENQAHRRLQIF